VCPDGYITTCDINVEDRGFVKRGLKKKTTWGYEADGGGRWDRGRNSPLPETENGGSHKQSCEFGEGKFLKKKGLSVGKDEASRDIHYSARKRKKGGGRVGGPEKTNYTE